MSPLSIAIIGAGNIGSTFAYQMARAGHQVTVVARPGSKRLQQLQRDKGVVKKNGDRAEMTVLAELDECVYDLVVVTTLAHQVEAFLPALKKSKIQCVHFMFNTFQPEQLSDGIGADRCTFGMPFVQALLDDEGILDSTVGGGPKTLHGDKRWAQLFNDAGMPSVYEPEMQLWLRSHVPMCIGMESICVAGKRRNGGASWGDAFTVARGMYAATQITKGLGYKIYPAMHSIVGSLPGTILAPLLWAISRNKSFRDLLASGENECRAIVDTVTAAGGQLKPTYRKAIKAVVAMRPRDGSQALGRG